MNFNIQQYKLAIRVLTEVLVSKTYIFEETTYQIRPVRECIGKTKRRYNYYRYSQARKSRNNLTGSLPSAEEQLTASRKSKYNTSRMQYIIGTKNHSELEKKKFTTTPTDIPNDDKKTLPIDTLDTI